MTKKLKAYNKLPGSKKGFFLGRYTLWQGSDHLLHIFARFGVEDYKRFYFNDIQAIIIRKTSAGKIQNIILGGGILLFLILILSVDGAGSIFLNGWAIFSMFMSAMMLLFLIVNLFKGPTCETKLLTAVQTEKLHTLPRLRSAFKIVDRLRPLIREAQRSVPRQAQGQVPRAPHGSTASRRPGPSQAAAQENIKKENGRAHMILFALLLLDGLLAASEFFVSHALPTTFSSLAGLCIGIFVIIALVRQHNSDLPGSLRSLTWACLGFVGVTFVMGYVLGMVLAFKNPSMIYNQWHIIKSLAVLSPWDSSLKLGYDILVIGGALFIGLPGLILLKRSRSEKMHPLNATTAAAG